MSSYAAINREFAPLSRALLKDGRPTAEATILGFRVVAERQRNLHVRYGGCGGPAWTVCYTADGHGLHASGNRDDMVEWILWTSRGQVMPGLRHLARA